MMRAMLASLAAIVISATLLGAVPANAQSSTAPVWQDKTSQHHQWIYRIMKDMTNQMGQMTEQMGGDFTPDQRLQMAQRMQKMSMLMRRLSGLQARPVMREGEWQKKNRPNAPADG